MTASFYLRILRVPVILVLLHFCSLTLVAQSQLITHPTKKIDFLNADKSGIIQTQRIPFRRFTLSDFKVNNQVPNATQYVTLKKNGKQIRLDALIDSANVYESRLNQWGYSLRDRSHPKSIQRSLGNKGTIDRNSQSFRGATKHFGEAPPAFLKMSEDARLSVIKAENNQRQQIDAAVHSILAQPHFTQQLLPLPTVLNGGDSHPDVLGDPDLFALTADRTINVSASYTICSTDVQANFGTSIIGNPQSILSVKGHNTSDSAGIINTTISAIFLGDDVLNILPQNSHSGIADAKNWPINRSWSWLFWVGPVPIECTLAFHGGAGVSYYSAAGALNSDLTVVPNIYSDLELSGQVDILCAGGGIGCSIEILHDTETCYGRAAREVGDTPIKVSGGYQYQQYLSIDYCHSYVMNALKGRVYAFAWVDFWLWSDEWDWTICDWPGFTYTGSMFGDSQVSDLVPLGKPVMSTKSPMQPIVKAPTLRAFNH